MSELNDGIGVASDRSSPSRLFCGCATHEEGGKGDCIYFQTFLSPLSHTSVFARAERADMRQKKTNAADDTQDQDFRTLETQRTGPPASRPHAQRTPTILRLHRELEPVPPQDRARLFPSKPYRVSPPKAPSPSPGAGAGST